MSAPLTIVQLYPDELGVAGDSGNALALRVRAELAGFDASTVTIEIGDPLPAEADAIVIGGGPVAAMRLVHDDLHSRGDALRRLVDDGVPLFAHGAGAELLGHRLTLRDGTTIDGLGILPMTAERIARRSVRYIVLETGFGTVVGFEDHASRWVVDSGAESFGRVIAGDGDGNGVEGVRTGYAIGTKAGGPALPLNPVITDALLARALERRGSTYTPGDAHRTLDDYAARAREVMDRHSDKPFTTI